MKIFTIFILVSIFLCCQSSGSTIHVPADTASIQEAINMAGNGDTVLVAEGTYYENINFKGKAITVASMFIMDEDTGHISKTIIDGSQNTNPDSGSVVYFVSGEDTTSILCGFKIVGGSGTLKLDPYLGRKLALGGGIFINESGAKIEGNLIMNNILDYKNGTSGGGICALKNKDGKRYIIIRNNSILYNYSRSDFSSGGGIYIGWEEKPVLNYLIENNDISFNTVENTDAWKAMGGGLILECILPSTGVKIVRNNMIRGNELHCVNSFGGGIYIIDWDDLTKATTTVYDSNPNPLFYNSESL